MAKKYFVLIKKKFCLEKKNQFFFFNTHFIKLIRIYKKLNITYLHETFEFFDIKRMA